MKTAKIKTKAKKTCSMSHCSNDTTSPRAKFCAGCFKTNALSASLKRKVYGGGGNRSAKGVLGNGGNIATGQKKKLAGKRSALRRSAKMLLVVKNPWLDLILSRRKTWEIRDAPTKQRGNIHLALSGAGGRIVGQCHIIDSFAIDKGALGTKYAKHRIEDLALITYRRPHVWVLSKARRFEKPFAYSHPQGAIQLVKL